MLELQAWIEEEVEKRWADIQQPWKAFQTNGVDKLTAENQYIQRYVSGLISATTQLMEFSARLIPFRRPCKRFSMRSRGLLG